MKPREIVLRLWVRSLLSDSGIKPEPGEVAEHARNLRSLEGHMKAADFDGLDRRPAEHRAQRYAANIPLSAPHLDMDHPWLPPPDVLVTRAAHQSFIEAE